MISQHAARPKACPVLFLTGLILMLSTSALCSGDGGVVPPRWQQLGARFTQLRDVGVRSMSAQELAAASNQVIAELKDLVESAGADANVRAKGQKLLSYAYHFVGREADSRSLYSTYLDTLAGHKGQDYAVMTVRRAGDRMLRKNDPTRALLYYGLLTEKYPSHVSKAEALYNSGLACIELGAYEEAVDRLGAAVEADPKGHWAPWALRRKAHALFLNRPSEANVSEALKTLEELAKEFPTPHWQAYVQYRKGYVLASGKKYVEALAEYSQGISQHPSSPYSNMARKHVKLIREMMEKELLLVKKRQQEEEEAEQEATEEPAGVETSERTTGPSVGPVSLVFPLDDDRLAGEVER